MKLFAAALLIAAVFAEKKEEVKLPPLIEASTKDTVNDCLFIEKTNQGAMKKLNEDGTPSTCWGMYFNLCDELMLMPTTSCTIMTYQNAKLDWLSSTISVNFWPFRKQPLERKEYNAEQTKRKAAATARIAAQAIAKSKNPKPTLNAPKAKKVCADDDEECDERVLSISVTQNTSKSFTVGKTNKLLKNNR